MREIRKILFWYILITIATLLLCSISHALDRCHEYIPDVRAQHIRYFGINYPWWYGVGQLQQESGCRNKVTAWDGGQGVAQFMPATEKACEKYLGALDMYNPEQAIKAQAWFMRQLHKENWNGALWLTYQAYNGGWKWLRVEFKKSGSQKAYWELMRASCVRKPINCKINYDYSKQIYRYGQQYKLYPDGRRYW